MINWNNLKNYFEDVLPDNNQELISAEDVRKALGAILDAFEASVQFAVPTPEKKTITVFRGYERSWQIRLSGANNTIGLFAFTTVSKRILILDEHFKITGAGVNRNFVISESTIDDFYEGEKIVYQENVRGGLIEFKIPQFAIQKVNGDAQYGWQYPGEEFQAIDAVGEPIFSQSKSFVVPDLSQATVLEHPFNTTNIDVRIKNARGQDIAFVSGRAVDASHVGFELEDGAVIPEAFVFIYAFPQ